MTQTSNSKNDLIQEFGNIPFFVANTILLAIVLIVTGFCIAKRDASYSKNEKSLEKKAIFNEQTSLGKRVFKIKTANNTLNDLF